MYTSTRLGAGFCLEASSWRVHRHAQPVVVVDVLAVWDGLLVAQRRSFAGCGPALILYAEGVTIVSPALYPLELQYNTVIASTRRDDSAYVILRNSTPLTANRKFRYKPISSPTVNTETSWGSV